MNSGDTDPFLDGIGARLVKRSIMIHIIFNASAGKRMKTDPGCFGKEDFFFEFVSETPVMT